MSWAWNVSQQVMVLFEKDDGTWDWEWWIDYCQIGLWGVSFPFLLATLQGIGLICTTVLMDWNMHREREVFGVITKYSNQIMWFRQKGCGKEVSFLSVSYSFRSIELLVVYKIFTTYNVASPWDIWKSLSNCYVLV